MRKQNSRTNRYFLAYATVATLLLVALYLAFLFTESRRVAETLVGQELEQTQAAADRVSAMVAAAHMDLQLLSTTPLLRAYLRSPGSAEREKLASLFSEVALLRGMYTQVRLLATDGMELVRINYHAGEVEEVGEQALQNKGGRYYFSLVQGASLGVTVMTPLDLNVENGAVIVPHEPQLRILRAVGGDKVEGFLVLNVDGAQLLQSVQPPPSDSFSLHHFVNGDGHWLLDPRGADAWGFQLPDRGSFAARYPRLWERMRVEGAGYLRHDGHIFVYRRLDPAQQLTGRSTATDHWYLVSEIPSSAFAIGTVAKRQPAAVFFGLLLWALVLAGCRSIAAFQVSRRRAWQSLEARVEARTRSLQDINRALRRSVESTLLDLDEEKSRYIDAVRQRSDRAMERAELVMRCAELRRQLQERDEREQALKDQLHRLHSLSQRYMDETDES